MKYWTIVFPGEHGQLVQETWTEDQIIASYYKYWAGKMFLNGQGSEVTKANCIDDWKVVHWATETDEFGVKL